MRERSDRSEESDVGERTCSCVWDNGHRDERLKVD